MEKVKVAAITTRNTLVDSNNFKQYLWATEKQARSLLKLQFDDDKKQKVYLLGDRGIRPCDIIDIRFMDLEKAKELPAFRSYVVKALAEEEKRGKLDTSNIRRLNG